MADSELTDGQRDALENLAAKKAGEPVDWINISDAMALARLGLAERTRQGWVISDEGSAMLSGAAPAA
jgi:hypothetical protein